MTCRQLIPAQAQGRLSCSQAPGRTALGKQALHQAVQQLGLLALPQALVHHQIPPAAAPVLLAGAAVAPADHDGLQRARPVGGCGPGCLACSQQVPRSLPPAAVLPAQCALALMHTRADAGPASAPWKPASLRACLQTDESRGSDSLCCLGRTSAGTPPWHAAGRSRARARWCPWRSS